MALIENWTYFIPNWPYQLIWHAPWTFNFQKCYKIVEPWPSLFQHSIQSQPKLNYRFQMFLKQTPQSALRKCIINAKWKLLSEQMRFRVTSGFFAPLNGSQSLTEALNQKPRNCWRFNLFSLLGPLKGFLSRFLYYANGVRELK